MNDKTQGHDQYFSKLVARTLRVLESIKTSLHPASLTEITSWVGSGKSSVFRILYTLEAGGYVERNGEGRYSLPVGSRQLLHSLFQTRVIQAALPEMNHLRRDFAETVNLAVLFDNHIEVVAVVESARRLRSSTSVGLIVAPHSTSLGKSIVAYQPTAGQENLLNAYGLHAFTDKTITNEIELMGEFERVRGRGYSRDMEETATGNCSLGTPIISGEGEVRSAVSLSIPMLRLPDDKGQKEMAVALKGAAESISGHLRSA